MKFEDDPKYIYHSFALLIPLCIYLIFPLRIHTWESYLYSDLIDNFQDLRDVFIFQNASLEGHLKNFPSINIFHPNHPLPHLIVKILSNFEGLLFSSSLKISQVINSFAGSIGVLYFYKILKDSSFKNVDALLASLIFAFSHLYWYQSLSGEVYSLSIAFSLIVFFKAQRINNLIFSKFSLTSLALITGLAFVSHMLALIYLPVFFYMTYDNGQTFINNIFKRNRPLLLSILFFSTIFYIAPHLSTAGIHNLSDFFYVIGAYAKIFGTWNEQAESIHFLTKILTSIKHLSRTFLANVNVPQALVNYLILLLTTIFSLRALFNKGKVKTTFACSIVIVLYYLIITFVIHLPEVNDYWIFILPFLFLLIFIQIRNFIYLRVVLVIVLLSFFTTNFINVIYPQSNLQDRNYWVADRIKIPLSYKIVIISGNPYSHQIAKQAWHLSRLNNKRNSIIVMNTKNKSQMEKLRKTFSKMSYLFTDLPNEELSILLNHNLIETSDLKFIRSFEINESEQVQNKAIGSEKIQENWKMNLFTFSSIDD